MSGRTLPCGEDIAPDVRQGGPAYWLMTEHWRRRHDAGFFTGSSWWGWWDANDYCLDAPDVMPAGSCWYVGPCLGIEQTTVRREGSA